MIFRARKINYCPLDLEGKGEKIERFYIKLHFMKTNEANRIEKILELHHPIW